MTRRVIGIALCIGVLAAIVFTTTFENTKQVEAQAAAQEFNAKDFASARYDKIVVPYVKKNATPLLQLLAQLKTAGADAKIGHNSGVGSPFSFATTFTGIAGKLDGSAVPITIQGLDASVVVQIQVGPAMNGTALRDVSGTISFNDVTNQIDYLNVATEFNNIAKAKLSSSLNASSIEGKTVTVVGAFTRMNPDFVSVVPVSISVK